jgi:hypothetical protein
MPACSAPPNRAPSDVIDRLIDAIAWAKTCMLITAATAPKSPERAEELSKLRESAEHARRAVNEVLAQGQILPDAVLVELRVCEIAIPKLEAGAILRQPAAEVPKT